MVDLVWNWQISFSGMIFGDAFAAFMGGTGEVTGCHLHSSFHHVQSNITQ